MGRYERAASTKLFFSKEPCELWEIVADTGRYRSIPVDTGRYLLHFRNSFTFVTLNNGLRLLIKSTSGKTSISNLALLLAA